MKTSIKTEIAAIASELRTIASSANNLANHLAYLHDEDEQAPDAPAQEPEKALALEDVRAVLAEKSRDGFTAQIRELLQKYGAAKLSDVDPASYDALMADAEVLGND